MGQICILGAFFKITRAKPFPHPTNNDGHNLFQVSTLYNVWRGRTARYYPKGTTVLRGHPEITCIYNYSLYGRRSKGKGKGIEGARPRAREEGGACAQIPPSPSPFYACHAG